MTKRFAVLFILLITMSVSQARLFDLDQAHHLIQVLDDVYDASLDSSQYFDITEVKKPSSQGLICKRVQNIEVLKRVKSSFEILKIIYPDEQFPLSDAFLELRFILGSSDYKLCSLPLDEAYDDVKRKDLYISLGTGISFFIESSYY